MKAEDHVASLLRERGWLILGRNFRTIGAELDIIARKKDLVVVFEVKARRRLPRMIGELLSFKKRMALERGARRFLVTRHIVFSGIRFDLVIVLLDKAGERVGMKYFPNAFEAKKL